jgi:signal transduction histidine kinase
VRAGLERLGHPLRSADLDAATARTLAAVAPHGLVFVPIDRSTLFALVGLGPEQGLDEDTVVVATMLARLTDSALANARAVEALRARCEELRRLSTHILERQDDDLGRTAYELHEGTCQRLAAANAQLEALGAILDGQRVALAPLRDARALVNQALGELRELAQRMRPSVLGSLGYLRRSAGT